MTGAEFWTPYGATRSNRLVIHFAKCNTDSKIQSQTAIDKIGTYMISEMLKCLANQS